MVRLVPSFRSNKTAAALRHRLFLVAVVLLLSLGWLHIILPEPPGATVSPMDAQLQQFVASMSHTETGHFPTLQCAAYGGPEEAAAQEMVYWQGRWCCRRGSRIEPNARVVLPFSAACDSYSSVFHRHSQ
jgi:hypothetical protein